MDLITSRIGGYNNKSPDEKRRFAISPKQYPNGDIEFEIDVSGCNIDSIEQIVESIHLLNKHSCDNGESNGNADFMMNFFGIPYANTFADKCIICHTFDDKHRWEAYFVIKKDFKIKTIKGSICQCSSKNCHFMSLDGPQMMDLIDGIRSSFDMQ